MQPKGGRGKTAPYAQTHIRVPLPIKDRVQQIIDEYRVYAIENNNSNVDEFISTIEIEMCYKMVIVFTNEVGISSESFEKPTRDNHNLKRFRDWLLSKLER